MRDSQPCTDLPKPYGFNVFVTGSDLFKHLIEKIIQEHGGAVYDNPQTTDTMNRRVSVRGYFEGWNSIETARTNATNCVAALTLAGNTAECVAFPHAEVEAVVDAAEDYGVATPEVARSLGISPDSAFYPSQTGEMSDVRYSAIYPSQTGETSDVRVYDRALTREEIEADYEAAIGATGPTGATEPVQLPVLRPRRNDGCTGPGTNPTEDYLRGLEHQYWSEGYDAGVEAATAEIARAEQIVAEAGEAVDRAERIIYQAELDDDRFDKGYSEGHDDGYDLGHFHGHEEGRLEGRAELLNEFANDLKKAKALYRLAKTLAK